MFQQVRLSPAQWRRFASACSTIGQAIVIFALGSIFSPDAVGLTIDFPLSSGLIYLFAGLLLVVVSVIISSKEKN